MRILVTNDDGVFAPGIRALAIAMCELDGDHEVVVAAPDAEFSGSGAALGSLQDIHPVIRRTTIEGCPSADIWSVEGPPALCVMFSRLGAFGPPFDLIVSGINPGANVGRAVYHSGTVGAALTGRNGRISGVAVSQAVNGVDGQAWHDAISGIDWSASAAIAKTVVQRLLDDGLPDDPIVININVPDLPLDQIKGWRHTEVGDVPPRTVSEAELVPVDGEADAFRVEMAWGEKLTLDEWTDGGAVEAGYVAVSNLARLCHQDRSDVPAASALTSVLP